jgi:hypothetical protein
MGQSLFIKDNNYDFMTLLNLNQAFVDTVRNTGGKNSDRLLIVAGMNQDSDITCTSSYKIPIDPSRKLAISFNYLSPAEFTMLSAENPWTYNDEQGNVLFAQPLYKWGSEYQYKELYINFQNFKEIFVDKGYPIVINGVGVLTEDKKEIKSIREYLYSVFSITRSFKGIMSCLLDNSNKKFGTINYYDRVNDKWYDEVIRDNFMKISQGDFLKFTDFSYYSNKDSVYDVDEEGGLFLKIGKKKVKKVIFKVKISIPYIHANFGVQTNKKNGFYHNMLIDGAEGKKNFDGSYTYTVDVSKKDFNDYVQIQKWWNKEYSTLVSLTVEFHKQYTFLNYTEFKRVYNNL